ncbi:hypothetical protein [Streptomyces sp. NBC_01669]|uniref:hypothetical protein n=2 Tax=unclassified Streptomyces TaxID=2593676 RepID=UPI002258A4F7|nr:hypothetical protein [Streptomyces sp. NBC_01669]MCX4531094.1 hypothetical protein [Streptomyces sp. NBC_01669]
MNVVARRSTTPPERPPWTWVEAVPSFHDGEEDWQSDQLVAVGRKGYPPRFRIAITCRTTDTAVCVPVHIVTGGFTVPDLQVTAHCPEGYATAIPPVMKGRYPFLARALMMVPDSVEVAPDGTWSWVPASWGWGGPIPERAVMSKAEVRSAATPEMLREMNERDRREEELFSDIKRRLSPKWKRDIVPRLKEYADFMVIRGISRAELAAEIEVRENISRSEAHKRLALAVEIGFIPTRDGHAPFYESSHWTLSAQKEGVIINSRPRGS